MCEGKLAALWRYDGDLLVGAAHHNVSPAYAETHKRTRLRPGPQGAARKAAFERRTIHVADLLAEPGFAPMDAFATSVQQLEQARTVLAVPLLRQTELLGVIAIWRREVRPFTEQQVALVRTFADQAVIAIENAKLFDEAQARTRDLSEALAQQTATSQVLGVISSSPGELEPVFQAMLENAVRICEAKFGVLNLHEQWGNARGRDAQRTVCFCRIPPSPARLVSTDAGQLG